MSTATSEQAPSRVLLLHREELDDVREVLDELAIPYEAHASVPPAEEGVGWQLVVATPQRILELRALGTTGLEGVAQIAVCDGFSRTLARKLSQARVDFVLRRPVHPGALRLLLLHAWYRGPEKRRDPRVSVGAPVRVKLGWRQRKAMLLEISSTGCRLQLDRMATAGTNLVVILPAELVRQRLRLKGQVVRSAAAAAGDAEREHEVAVQFKPLSAAALATVRGLIREHGQGPAAWKEAPLPDRRQPAAPVESGPDANRRDPETPDRRQSPRLRYAKPVLVKGEGASRVLMGQDLSSGGMRVMRDPGLSVGDALKLALYGEDGVPPLLLQAKVAREDGGFLILRFADLGDAGRQQLERFMSSAPVSSSEDGGDTALVVSEIVEQTAEANAEDDAEAPSEGDTETAPDGDAPTTSDGDAPVTSDGDATATSDDEVETTSDGDVEPTSDGDVEPTSDGDVEPTSDDEFDATAEGEVDTTAESDAETTSERGGRASSEGG